MLQLMSKVKICELCSRASSFSVIRKLIHGGGMGERVIGFLPQYSSGSKFRDPLLSGTSTRYLTGGSAQSYRPRLGIPLVLPWVSVSAQHRRFSKSQMMWDGRDKADTPENLLQDPQIKEWMKELHRDFEREKCATEKRDDGISEQESPAENEGKKTEGRQDSKKTHHLGQPQQQSEDREGNKSKEIQPGIIMNTNIPSSAKVTSELPFQSPVKAWAQFTTHKYERFDSQASPIIYDYDEERLRREQGLEEVGQQEEERKEKVVIKRGERGVFDVEELVDLLREENARDVAVVQVPSDMSYVEFLVVVSGRSKRHMEAIAQLVRRAYISKKNSKDPPLFLEGRGTDWVAMDMRNIALHIMTPEKRAYYDLETLWTVGPEYDDKCQEPENDDSDLLGLGATSIDPLASLGGVHSPATPSPSQG